MNQNGYINLGNKKLEELKNSLGFELLVFDDKGLKKKILLRDKASGTEIDGVMFYNNLIFLFNIYEGKDAATAETKISNFSKGLRSFKNVNDVKKLSIDKSFPSCKEKKKAIDKLELIKKQVNNFKATHKILIKKVCFSPEVDIKEEIEDKYKSEEVFIIDKEIYFYLQKIYKTLGKGYLFRDLMNFFNIKKGNLKGKSASATGSPGQIDGHRVERLDLGDGGMVMYSTSFPIRDLEELVTVFRVGQRKYNIKGFQRMLKEKRLEKIAKEYLESSKTFPNNIVIALNPELYNNEPDFFKQNTNEIKLFDEYNSLLIIDGQHRFFSFIKGNKKDREALFTFIYFPSSTNAFLEMYKMFYKINNSQEKVDASLSFVLKAMIYPDSQAEFWFYVLRRLNNEKGFFKDKISFKEKELRYEDEKGIISVITYGGLLSLNKPFKRIDGLEKLYGNKTKKNKIKFASNLLKNYFSLIEEVLISKGKNKDFLTPRDIGAFIRLIRHFLVMIKDGKKIKILGEIDNIKKIKKIQKKSVNYIRNKIKCIDFDEISQSALSASNWAGVEGLLLKQIHKRKKNIGFGNKRILSEKGLISYNT